MEHSPPPLFKQGPPPLVRLIFFVLVSLALLISDARYSTLNIVRGALGTLIYPLQRAALMPRDAVLGTLGLFVSSSKLRSDNATLRTNNLHLSMDAHQAQVLAAENAHLRALLGLRGHFSVDTTPVEIQYDAGDPFSQKIIIGHGLQDGIQNGSPVVTEDGVIGQVTRVFPLQSEITLVTDHDLAIPVESLRTGLRSVIYGTSKGDGTLDLRFVPTSADVQVGDELVTSGLDSIYPPGLPVAKVTHVDKVADTAFAHVVCTPLAAVRGARDMLVLHYKSDTPPLPDAPEPASAPAKSKKKNAAAYKITIPKAAPTDASAAAAATAPAAKAAPHAKAVAKPVVKPAAVKPPPPPPATGSGGIDE